HYNFLHGALSTQTSSITPPPSEQDILSLWTELATVYKTFLQCCGTKLEAGPLTCYPPPKVPMPMTFMPWLPSEQQSFLWPQMKMNEVSVPSGLSMVLIGP